MDRKEVAESIYAVSQTAAKLFADDPQAPVTHEEALQMCKAISQALGNLNLMSHASK